MTDDQQQQFPEMLARKLFMELPTIPYVRRSTSRSTSGNGNGTQPIAVTTSESPRRASDTTSPRDQCIVASWDQLGKVQKHIKVYVTADNKVEVLLAPRPELSTNADFEPREPMTDSTAVASRSASAGSDTSPNPNLRPQVAHSPDST